VVKNYHLRPKTAIKLSGDRPLLQENKNIAKCGQSRMITVFFLIVQFIENML